MSDARSELADSRIDSVLRRLWPTDFPQPRTELYAILDGARDRRVHRAVAASNHEWRCLWAGRLPPPLVEVAPYLVRFDAHTTFARDLLRDGWGRSWGIWLHSPAGIDELRLHFRRFLRVQDEDRRRLIFRYYDPRVLRVYLPTCTPDERRFLFGPVERFCLENDDGGVIDFPRDPSQSGNSVPSSVTRR